MPVPVIRVCLMSLEPDVPEINDSLWRFGILDPRQHVDLVVPESILLDISKFLNLHLRHPDGRPLGVFRERRQPRRDFPFLAYHNIKVFELDRVWIHLDTLKVAALGPVQVFFDHQLEGDPAEESTGLIRIGRPLISKLRQMTNTKLAVGRFQFWYACG